MLAHVSECLLQAAQQHDLLFAIEIHTGRDLDVDLLDDRWAVYRVRDPAKAATLPGGIHRPLVVGRLAGRDARDKLPTGHPSHGEL